MMKSLIGAVMGAAIVASAGTAAAQTRSIVIGYELPLSGDSSHYGEVFRNAATIKLQEFNAAGGMQGATVTLRYEDSKNDAKEARNIAQMFVDDKAIVGVLGDFSSTASMAAAEIYGKAGMPQLSQTASHPDFVKISNWQFRNITTQSYEGPFNAGWMRQTASPRPPSSRFRTIGACPAPAPTPTPSRPRAAASLRSNTSIREPVTSAPS